MSQPTPAAKPHSSKTLALALGALGIVFGDIGTSPLYAFRECLHSLGKNGSLATPQLLESNVIGLLSMFVWVLILIVSIKYIMFVMRADKRGEGGILALLAVGFPDRKARWRTTTGRVAVGLGVFGACLLYGDGIITPAISVLSAVEGIEQKPMNIEKLQQAAAHVVGESHVLPHAEGSGLVIPITVAILLTLFAFQRFGTTKVGRLFGPITLIWFLVLQILGVRWILENPQILHALNPWHALHFAIEHTGKTLVAIGGVALVVTGGEALYADMGHFGRRPIRLAWYTVVLPALIINYLGQGALVLKYPSAMANPFYCMGPEWFHYPLVVLATLATVIASQALISGAYSLTMQAIQLGYIPRMRIDHTSHEERGQIYISRVNWILAIMCTSLVIGFKSSANLANAYAIAVTLTMLITTILFYFAARRQWEWPVWKALGLCLCIGLVEALLVSGNLIKFAHGGWFPITVGIILFIIMVTWKDGRRILSDRLADQSLPLKDFQESISRGGVHRVPGTAIFMAGTTGITPTALLHNLKHNKVLHNKIIFLTIESELAPYTKPAEQIHVEQISEGMWRIIGKFGFMERPDVPKLLENCAQHGLTLDPMTMSFFLGRETIIPTGKSLALWRAKLFGILSRNAESAVAYYNIPPSRVVEFGIQIEL